MYNEEEIIDLENKHKYLLDQAKQITESIQNLQIVKGSMSKAIGKIRGEKDQSKKRIDSIKQQTEILREQYRNEIEVVRQQEQEYNKSHQKHINLGEYYRSV